MKLPKNSKLVFKGDMFDTYQWPQKMFDGSTRTFEMLKRADTVHLIATTEDNKIIEIGQKPRSLDEIEGQYMGLMKFSAEGIKQVKKVFYKAIEADNLLGKSIETAYMTDLLQALINSGNPVTAVPVYGDWVEVDTVEDLECHITKKRLKCLNG